MKKSLHIAIVSALSIFIPLTSALPAEVTIAEAVKKFTEGKKGTRIAVFDFINTAGDKTRYDGYIADTITTELSGYPVTLLERKRLELLLKEHALSQTGVIDPEGAVKLGLLLPVDVVVSGSYTLFEDRIVINGRFIHVTTGEIMYAFTSTIKEKTGDDKKSGPDKSDKASCEPVWAEIKKAMSDLRTDSAIKNAADKAVSLPFADECGKIHYEIMYIFSRNKIFPEKYTTFLIKTLDSIDDPSNDGRSIEIMRFFAADGSVSESEWNACVEAIKKMRTYSLHIPLSYMLNNGKENKTLVEKRADDIMALAMDKKIGRPVAVSPEEMIFSLLSGLKTYNNRDDMEIPAYIFKKYQHLIPDNDKYNKEAAGFCETMYFSEKDRTRQKEILSLLIDFYKSRVPSEVLADKCADLIKSVNSKIESPYEKDKDILKAYNEDIKIINASLEELYCVSLGTAKNKGYIYIVDEEVQYVLRNGMKCGLAPTIKDLEADMRSGDWDKKLKAIELLSKIGEAAREAEDTIILYLGQQGYGSQGGQLRGLCARTLGNIGTTREKALWMLIESFPDYDNGVSYEAEEAIKKIGTAAIPQLIKGLQHKEHAVRLRCSAALGNLGKKAKESVPDLKRLAEKDTDPYVRKEAQGAIQMINNDF